MGLPIAIAALLVVTFAARRNVTLWDATALAPKFSVAVLPFHQYSSDPVDERLAANLTDGVTTELARIVSLAVVSHTTALQVGSRKSIKEIAQTLGVDVIVEGAVRRDGTRIEADVRLAASNPDSRAGIACRVGSGLNFFAFNLIASRGYEIVRVVNGKPTVLTQGRISMDPAEGARLGANCHGAALSLSLNGRELASVSDTALADNTGAGLLSLSPVIAATNAAFDNFELSSLSGAAATT